MKKFLLITVMLLSLMGCAVQANPVAVDIFMTPDNMVGIPVRINKKEKAIFILDTGASQTVLAEWFAKQLKNIKYSGETYISTANGIAKVKVAEVELIEIGGLDRRKVQVIVAPFPPDFHFGGLIGRDLIQNFQLQGDMLIVE